MGRPWRPGLAARHHPLGHCQALISPDNTALAESRGCKLNSAMMEEIPAGACPQITAGPVLVLSCRIQACSISLLQPQRLPPSAPSWGQWRAVLLHQARCKPLRLSSWVLRSPHPGKFLEKVTSKKPTARLLLPRQVSAEPRSWAQAPRGRAPPRPTAGIGATPSETPGGQQTHSPARPITRPSTDGGRPAAGQLVMLLTAPAPCSWVTCLALALGLDGP